MCAEEEEKEVDSFFAPPAKSVLASTAPWGLQLDQLPVAYFRVSFCQTAVLFSHFAVLHKILTFSFLGELLLENHDSAKML